MNTRNRNRSADIQVPMTQAMTQEQSNQLFEIAREAALAEIQSEQNAAAAKLQLEQDYMKAESAARIAAFTTTSSANESVDPRRRPLGEEDDDIGEIPLEARSMIHRFPSLPKEDIIRIFRNKFRTINLFRFRHMRGICEIFFF